MQVLPQERNHWSQPADQCIPLYSEYANESSLGASGTPVHEGLVAPELLFTSGYVNCHIIFDL